MKEIKVKLTFTEAVLGTCPGNPDIYREFIGGNAPDADTLEDEVAALGVEALLRKARPFSRSWTMARRSSTIIRLRAFSRIPAAACGVSREQNPAVSRHTRRKSTN